ncbi:MAG: ester cyclase [Halarcobacter sp.]
MKSNNYKNLVKLYYEELWNKHNKEYIDILFDEEITFHGSLNVVAKGKKEFETYMDNVLTGIPNLYHGVEIMISEDDKIAVRAVYNGTHKGKLFDFEPTNNRIKYNGASFFRFKDGKICDIWVLGDLATLHKQLIK